MQRVRDAIRARHYSRATEKAYAGWIRRFILFHGKRHPSQMGEREIVEFLSYLASEQRVSASTQNQALSALLFLYRQVMERELRTWAFQPMSWTNLGSASMRACISADTFAGKR